MRSAAPALVVGSVAVPGERGGAGRSGGVGPGDGGKPGLRCTALLGDRGLALGRAVSSRSGI